jgi:hypothetical protein
VIEIIQTYDGGVSPPERIQLDFVAMGMDGVNKRGVGHISDGLFANSAELIAVVNYIVIPVCLSI